MPSSAEVINALRSAHEQFADLVASLDADAIRGPSYCDGWTIAQVASHIGSGSELAIGWLAAAIAHTDPMPREEMPKVWDAWNARSPEEQVRAAVETSGEFVAAMAAATDEELRGGRVALFGGVFEADGIGVGMLRLPELVIHTWDIAVMSHPDAHLLAGAVDLGIDLLPERMGRLGKPEPGAWVLRVSTSGPAHEFTLTNTGEAVTLAPGAPTSGDGVLELSAEALLRLAYGRTRPGDITLDSATVSVETLASTFPGF